jgi:hypothetical protein
MIKAPINLQELRGRIYRKAKSAAWDGGGGVTEYLFDLLGPNRGWGIQFLPGLEGLFVKAIVVRQDP